MSFYGRYRGFGDDGDFTLPSFDTTPSAVTDGSTTANFVMANPVAFPSASDSDGPGAPMGSQAQFTAGQAVPNGVPPVPGAASTSGSPPLVSVPANNSAGSASGSGGSFLSSAQGMLNIFGQAVGVHPATTALPVSSTPTWIVPVAILGALGIAGIVLISSHKKTSMGRYKRSRR